ncbi:MAG: DUF2249 domain-containing protein [Pollutimonas bauzanensis]|uniref:Uncharacterized conserved protein n=1 Tax=Pollutimonas bauzanensis TaxID=658167 RepID=A0A1M5XQK1_9BURK|nr:DUF2249 domain-containing protein [Pollutimonas bauzanensis]SHI02125.1 Uncharacterized conserved protein [Pollutimonas bauzanensis]
MTPELPEHEITLDARGLEPPEPLELVLEALSVLERHQRLRMLIDREPRPLYPILDNNNFSYLASATADFRYEILIWHKG